MNVNNNLFLTMKHPIDDQIIPTKNPNEKRRVTRTKKEQNKKHWKEFIEERKYQ